MTVLLFALMACGGSPSEEPPAAEAPAAAVELPVTTYNLARLPSRVVSLDIPDSSHDRPISKVLRSYGEVTKRRETEAFAEYSLELPLAEGLFTLKSYPDLLQVKGPGRALAFSEKARPGTWYSNGRSLLIRLRPDAAAPVASDYKVTCEKAAALEAALNFKTSGLKKKEAFAFRSETVAHKTYMGVFLPAPAEVSWELVLPRDAALTFDSRMLPAPIRGVRRSDGALVEVEVVLDSGPVSIGRYRLSEERPFDARFDLSEVAIQAAGQPVTLRIRTSPGESALNDYVFLGEPAVFTPKEDPERVLLVFVDTLRADHLGMYGYDRDTSPRLDQWAEGAAVFEQARSVAPWTLPATRAALSGQYPELWFEQPHLAELFGAAGFVTTGYSSNHWFAPAFDMTDGWTEYAYEATPTGKERVDQGLEALARYPDRDLLVMLHFIDTHLPYGDHTESKTWAGARPRALPSGFKKKDVSALDPTSDEHAASRQHMADRYDESILFLDEQIHRALTAFGEDATVVFFADHGEELWDHGKVEHGHTLYDELLRVPLVVKSPDITPGRYAQPASLLDITPTLSELFDLNGGERAGLSLLDPTTLEGRTMGFGYVLSGQEGWGVLDGSTKWWLRDAQSHLYKLTEDPGETANLAGEAELSGWPETLAVAMEREVREVVRLEIASRQFTDEDGELMVSHPEGFEVWWTGSDPRGILSYESGEVGKRVFLRGTTGQKWPINLYLLPNGDPEDLSIRLTLGKEREKATWAEGPMVSLGHISVTTHVEHTPLPVGEQLAGDVDEVMEGLKALGYMD